MSLTTESQAKSRQQCEISLVDSKMCLQKNFLRVLFYHYRSQKNSKITCHCDCWEKFLICALQRINKLWKKVFLSSNFSVLARLNRETRGRSTILPKQNKSDTFLVKRSKRKFLVSVGGKCSDEKGQSKSGKTERMFQEQVEIFYVLNKIPNNYLNFSKQRFNLSITKG